MRENYRVEYLNEKYKEYDEQLKKLKKICSKLKKAPRWNHLSEKYGLRSSRWFIIYCRNKKVINYDTFMEYEVGIRPNYLMSKEMVEAEIMKFYNKYGRSPRRYDFENKKLPFSISTVVKKFGSIRKMRKEMGFPSYTVGGNDRIETTKNIFKYINKFLKSLDKNVFTREQLNEFLINNNIKITHQTIDKRIKNEFDFSFREYAEKKGFYLVKPGSGLFYRFEDGEIAMSSHENIFSEILRKNNFIFGKTYFRDLKYSKIFKNVNKNYTLDYFIIIGRRKIYIEIAGILRDHERFYFGNIEIKNSNSKEKYRVSLLKKEKIMRKNKVEYYILFPNKYKKFDDIVYKNLEFLKRGN